MKPFRFGVNVRSATSGREWAEKARRIEALGYTTLAVPDHLADMLAPIPAAIGAAHATARLVAREAATADFLTGGCFQLGLDAGHMKAEYDEVGLTFDRGAVRPPPRAPRALGHLLLHRLRARVRPIGARRARLTGR